MIYILGDTYYIMSNTIDWFEELEVELKDYASQATLNFSQRGTRKY